MSTPTSTARVPPGFTIMRGTSSPPGQDISGGHIPTAKGKCCTEHNTEVKMFDINNEQSEVCLQEVLQSDVQVMQYLVDKLKYFQNRLSSPSVEALLALKDNLYIPDDQWHSSCSVCTNSLNASSSSQHHSNLSSSSCICACA